MMNHKEIDALLPAFVLGGLEPHERVEVHAHLAVCGACEKRLLGYRGVSTALLFSCEEREPRPELKAELMRRVRSRAQPSAPWWRAWTTSFGPWAGALAACAVLLWVWVGQRTPRAGAVAAKGEAPNLRLTLKSGRITQAGHVLQPGASLDWGSSMAATGGDAQIMVEKSAVLLLREGSQLGLSRDKGVFLADLPLGTLFSAVVPGTPFDVQAGSARVDAHGTLFLVRHIEDQKAYVCICRGSIGVHAPGFEREMTSSNDAQESGLNLDFSGAPTLAEDAKAAYYTDPEEDALKDALKDVMAASGSPSGGAGNKGGDKD